MERKSQCNGKYAKADICRVLDSMNSPCFELNRELEITYVNRAFLSLSRLTPEDILSAGISDIAYNSAEDFKQALLPGGADSCFIKSAGLTFNGRYFTSAISINKLYDESGALEALMCVLQGITSLYNDESLKRELRKLRAVCIFSGGAAHDYNNALTAVMGNLSLAKLEAEGNRELSELLKDAETASNKIRQLTEKITLYARGIKIKKDKTDIAGLIREIAGEAGNGYRGSCSFSAENDIPAIEVDKELVSEAFLCILENALEAAPSEKGEVTVTVSRAGIKEGSVFPGTSVAEGDYISISVSDNGPGLGGADRNLIFSPYYSTREGRDGIGLALSYSILKRHRGFIIASGSETGGASFTMYLPLF